VTPKTLVRLRALLHHYAAESIDLTDAHCHAGLCSAEECGRCRYVLEARALLHGMAQRSRLGNPVHRSKSTARPEYRRHKAEKALAALLTALHEAREAGAPYTVERIKLAVASARGAVRNAGYRVTAARRRG
jgi:hypothetical protein